MAQSIRLTGTRVLLAPTAGARADRAHRFLAPGLLLTSLGLVLDYDLIR